MGIDLLDVCRISNENQLLSRVGRIDEIEQVIQSKDTHSFAVVAEFQFEYLSTEAP